MNDQEKQRILAVAAQISLVMDHATEINDLLWEVLALRPSLMPELGASATALNKFSDHIVSVARVLEAEVDLALEKARQEEAA